MAEAGSPTHTADHRKEKGVGFGIQEEEVCAWVCLMFARMYLVRPYSCPLVYFPLSKIVKLIVCCYGYNKTRYYNDMPTYF